VLAVILQPVLIIGTLISSWYINWSGYARLVLCIKLFLKLSMLADDTISAGKEFHSLMLDDKMDVGTHQLWSCPRMGQDRHMPTQF